MGLFSRITSIFSSEANAALDNIEDPIKMSKEAIRQLEAVRDEALTGLATIESIRINNQAKADSKNAEAQLWHKRAVKLNEKLTAGEIEKEDGESLIITALDNKDKAANEAKVFEANAKSIEVQVKQMNEKISKLSTDINHSKEDLALLEARNTTANAMLKVNQELSDNSATDSAKSILERMNQRVTKTENLATAYGNIDDMNQSDEAKIEEILNKPSVSDKASRLDMFRKNL
jgi:phage shock protein A